MRFGGGNFVFNAGEHAEFGLYGDIELMCVVHNLLGESDVLLVGKRGCVDHNGAEAHINAALAGLEAVAVVEVEADLGLFPAEFLGVCNSTFSHVTEKSLVGIVAGALGYLEDNRGLGFGSGHNNGLELLHIVEIECRDGISTFDCLGEHLTSVHEA